MVHLFSYPRSPKQNSYVERFNRTVREDLVEEYRELLEYDLGEFNNRLIDYLLFYDTERPHYSLKGKVPLRVVSDRIKEISSDPEESNMYWTHTTS